MTEKDSHDRGVEDAIVLPTAYGSDGRGWLALAAEPADRLWALGPDLGARRGRGHQSPIPAARLYRGRGRGVGAGPGHRLAPDESAERLPDPSFVYLCAGAARSHEQCTPVAGALNCPRQVVRERRRGRSHLLSSTSSGLRSRRRQSGRQAERLAAARRLRVRPAAGAGVVGRRGCSYRTAGETTYAADPARRYYRETGRLW